MKARIPSQPCISFDVFDTLLKRSVAKPTDLFFLMEKTYGKVVGIPQGFAQRRMIAEGEIYTKTLKPVTLEQIYTKLADEYGQQVFDWMEIELQMELDGCRPNQPIIELYKSCLESGKKIVLISNMYLPSQFLTQMLEKCGIEGYLKLYVSSEVGLSKGRGLFKFVLEDLGTTSKELCHIGDSWKADFIAPHLLGIKAIHIKKSERELCRQPRGLPKEALLTYRTLQACIRNCSFSMSEIEYQGAKVLGSLLVGYSYWLYDQLRHDGIKDVYFLSRDGWMFKQAFDLLGIEGIRTHYLYASRRSYTIPILWAHCEFDDVLTCLYPYPFFRVTLRVFLKQVGLDPGRYRDLAIQQGLDMDHLYEHGSLRTSPEVRRFYDSIKQEVVENSKKEYRALVAYLQDLNLPKKIAVSDVGYSGASQYVLQEILRIADMDVSLKGYYYAVNPDSFFIQEGVIQISAYLNNGVSSSELSELLHQQLSLLETQLLKPEGSVKRFSLKEGKGCPEFGVFYAYAKDPTQLVDEYSVIKKYQAGALTFVTDIHTSFSLAGLPLEPIAFHFNFMRLADKPTLREIKFWGDFRCEDLRIAYMAHPASLRIYLRHPKKLKGDILDSNVWRVGFLRRLFKLPLPYGKILDLAHKIYRNIK